MLSHEQDGSPFEPRYDLGLEVMQQIVQDSMREVQPRTPGIQYVEVQHDHPLANVGRSIERQVFEKAFGNDVDEMASEYGPYEEQSLFYVAFDPTNSQPVGVMRVIVARKSGQTLKLIDDMRGKDGIAEFITDEQLHAHHNIDDLSKCWELGTIAIMPEYRNSKRPFYKKGVIAAQLIRTMYLSARSQGIEHMVAAMDTEPYEKMVRGYLGLPYVPLCNTDPFPYLGSESTRLIYGHVPDFYIEMRRKMHTAKGVLAHSALRLLVLGKDDASIHLPDEHTPRIYQADLR